MRDLARAQAAEPWMLGHLDRAYWLWDHVNRRSYAGQLSTPLIRVELPHRGVERHAFADIGPANEGGARLEVRIHPELLRGTIPDYGHTLDSYLLHEMVHAWQVEVLGWPWEADLDWHGRTFAASWPRLSAPTPSTSPWQGGPPGNEAPESVQPHTQACAAAGLQPLRSPARRRHARLQPAAGRAPLRLRDPHRGRDAPGPMPWLPSLAGGLPPRRLSLGETTPAMTWSVQQAQARLAAELDQDEARIRDLERLLELLRPLGAARGPAWWVLRRLPPGQRAEVRALRRRLGR